MKAEILHLPTVEDVDKGYSIRLMPESDREKSLLRETFETWSNQRAPYFISHQLAESTNNEMALTLDLIRRETVHIIL